MNDLRALLKLEFYSLFGINRAINTKEPKEKSRNMILLIAYVILVMTCAFYVGSLVYGLCFLGLSSIVPMYLTFIASAIIVFFGIFTMGGKIFGQNGYDILSSMPIKPSSIVISRFLITYFTDLIFSLVIVIPGVAVYGFMESPTLIFYILMLVVTLFIPLVPLVINTFIGTAIYFISSKMKKKSLAQTLLAVIVIIGVMVLSFSLGYGSSSMTPEDFANLANAFKGAIGNIYPLALWMNGAVIECDLLALLLYVGVSLISAVAVIFLTCKLFTTIVTRFLNFSAKHDYKIQDMQSNGLIKALTVREAKRYFSSSIYVTNTIIGPILASVMAVATCFVDMSTITSGIPLPINVNAVMPFLLSAIFCMMTTSSVSISMEGKEFWAIKSLPISAKTLFDSKILFNLLLMLPFYLVSVIALSISLKPTPMEFVWIVAIPLSLMVFVVVLGIAVNLKLHSFNWANEAAVVKQSAEAFLGGFAGFVVGAVLVVVSILLPSSFTNIFNAVVLLVLWALIILMYTSNNKKRLEDL